jgi:hypothetical protein
MRLQASPSAAVQHMDQGAAETQGAAMVCLSTLRTESDIENVLLHPLTPRFRRMSRPPLLVLQSHAQPDVAFMVDVNKRGCVPSGWRG